MLTVRLKLGEKRQIMVSLFMGQLVCNVKHHFPYAFDMFIKLTVRHYFHQMAVMS